MRPLNCVDNQIWEQRVGGFESLRPDRFSLFPAKRSAKQLKIRRSFGFEVDGEDIEADRNISVRQLAQVIVGHLAQHPLLLTIHGGFRGSYGARGPCFYLNEAEDVFLPRNQIEIASCLRGTPAARGDNKAQAAEVEEGCAFAAASGREVRSLPLATNGCAVEALEKSFEDAEAKSFKPGHSVDYQRAKRG